MVQEGFKGGFLEHLNPIQVPFLGDSDRILGTALGGGKRGLLEKGVFSENLF